MNLDELKDSPVIDASSTELQNLLTKIFIYTTKPKFIWKGGVPCILPMAIIGRLKVSCRTGPAATTMTAAETGPARSAGDAGSISQTAEIGSSGIQNALAPG